MKTAKKKVKIRCLVIRGGSRRNSSVVNFSACVRWGSTTETRNNCWGFRCVQRGCRQILKGVTPP